MPVIKSQRDLNIESLRCVLMIGVCIVHSIFAGIRNCEVLSISTIISGLAHCSVDGFVLISGYYGIRFSWMKLGKLYAVGVLYSCLTGNPMAVLHGFWFLHAYAVLMMIAPLLSFERNPKQAWPLLLLIFGYGWFANLPHLKFLDLPLRTSFCSHTWMTLVGMYILGRTYRVYEMDQRISLAVSLIGICVCSVVNGLQFGYLSAYNGPFCAGLAVFVFTAFKKLNIRAERFPKFAISLYVVGPSLFPVYIIHQTPVGQELIQQLGAYRVNLGGGAIYGLLLGVVVFVVCIAIDSVRRMVLFGMGKLWERVR